MKRLFIGVVFIIICVFLFPETINARSGCCSHHGGVCGCGCCDGSSLSTTCAPYYPECSQPIYTAPAPTKMPTINTPKASISKSTIEPSPTSTPSIDPTVTPDIKAVDTHTPSDPVPPSNTSDILTGLGVIGFTVWLGWNGLKWLGKKTG